MTTTDTGCAHSTQVALASQRAVTEASRLFNLDVFDPPIGSRHPRAQECLSIISGIMRRNGWEPAGGYRGNGPPQWCGMFVGDCWRAAGLNEKYLREWFASTLRLHAWARYLKNPVSGHDNPRPAEGARLCGELAPGKPLPFEPCPGDIVIVGDGTPKDGDHITLAVAYSETRRTFNTISGNGGGFGPYGNNREGISMREYSIDSGKYKAMIVIRPGAADLV